MYGHASGGGGGGLAVLNHGHRSLIHDITVEIEPSPSPSPSVMSNRKRGSTSGGGSSAAIAAPSAASQPILPSRHSPPVMEDETEKKMTFFGKLCLMLSPKKPNDDKAAAAAHAEPRPPVRLARPAAGSEFESVFRYFDENGDGKISPSELRSRLRTVGEEVSEAEAEEVVLSSDSDGDGLLGFDDFVRLVAAEGEGERVAHLREAYAMYEMEGEGRGGGGITPKSLSRMLARLGEERSVDQCRAMIRTFDLDGDGVISFDEFKLMML